MSKLCKFCYDAKRKDYNTHTFRHEVTNEIACPYLLNEVTCGYCKKQNGHTTKYCPTLLKKNLSMKVPPVNMKVPPSVKVPPVKVLPVKVRTNRFELLETLMEEEEEEAPAPAPAALAPAAAAALAPAYTYISSCWADEI